MQKNAKAIGFKPVKQSFDPFMMLTNKHTNATLLMPMPTKTPLAIILMPIFITTLNAMQN
jgi:hypothetical protein